MLKYVWTKFELRGRAAPTSILAPTEQVASW